MKVDIDPSDITGELKADSRGRITLGSEYANTTVVVAVLEVEE